MEFVIFLGRARFRGPELKLGWVCRFGRISVRALYILRANLGYVYQCLEARISV